jgi:hypothetical protein
MRFAYLVPFLGLLICAEGAHGGAQRMAEPLPCSADKPKKEHVLRGMFTVHVVCERVLFEIPPKLLGREMMLNTELAAMSAGLERYAPGAVVANLLVRWIRRGSNVFLERVVHEMRAEPTSGLRRNVEAGQLGTVIMAFDTVAESEDGAPIIDVTPIFVDTPPAFAQELKQYFQMHVNDPKRSYVERVKTFPENIQIRFYHTWMPDPKDLADSYKPGRTPLPASLGFGFSTSLLLLPEEPMKGRYSDPRVGYFDVEFRDYGTKLNRGVKRGFITRYRLEKKDPDAEISEPIKPIVFYITDEVPPKWRPYLKRGIEAWQKPLEKAGFKNAIIARDQPTAEEDPDWDPEDTRYSVIRWAASPRENAMGPATVDPRSGEVISSHALFWNDVLRHAETWYFTQAAALDPRAQRLPLPDELSGEILTYVTTHEVGHALGLRHNFKAQSAVSVEQLRGREWTEKWGTSASIMSYGRFNYVAQPGDDAALFPRFGPYDYFAIEWGYKPLGNTGMSADDERPMLDEMAARQVEDHSLRFGGEDAVAPFDPSINTNVLGADPVESADYGLRNIDRIAPLLVPATSYRGYGYEWLARLYYELVNQRYRELAAVAKVVGGVEETRYQAARGNIPFTPVSPERQRAAVRFLVARAFTKPETLLDREILGRMSPTGGDNALQGSNAQLLQLLLKPGVFARMVEASAAAPKAQSYTGLDMLEDLNRGLFSELSAALPEIDPYRRTLQRNYVKILRAAARLQDDEPQPRSTVYATSALADSGEQFNLGGGPSEMRAAVRWALGDLAKQIHLGLGKVKDPDSWAHLTDLQAEVTR